MIDYDARFSLPFLAAGLWRLGGTNFPPFGNRWRRLIYPLILMSVLLVYSVTWTQSMLTGLMTGIVTRLGYGDSSNWLRRFLVGCSYGLSASVFLAAPNYLLITWMTLGMGVLFTLLLWLSRRFNWFSHSLVELVAGASHALIVLKSLSIMQGV